MRVFNFSAGPAVLPEAVLQRAAAEMLDWHGSGMSVMEMSHRGKEFIAIADEGRGRPAHAARDPDDYEVLFLQGGAIGENAIVPMNLLGERNVADYVNTGEWSKKSIKEAKKYCTGQRRRIVARTRTSPMCRSASAWKLTRRCGLRARLHQRDDRRRRVPLDARHRRRAAGRRHVVAPPVACRSTWRSTASSTAARRRTWARRA